MIDIFFHMTSCIVSVDDVLSMEITSRRSSSGFSIVCPRLYRCLCSLIYPDHTQVWRINTECRLLLPGWTTDCPLHVLRLLFPLHVLVTSIISPDHHLFLWTLHLPLHPFTSTCLDTATLCDDRLSFQRLSYIFTQTVYFTTMQKRKSILQKSPI